MKISIIGAHKTGKTTLLSHIIRNNKESFNSFFIIPEIIQNYNFQTKSFFEYMRIQEKVLIEQLILEELHHNTISDRSMIDNFAYMLTRFMHEFPQYDTKEAFEKIYNLNPHTIYSAMKKFKSYDLLFYLPIEFKNSEATEEQLLYQRTIDKNINFLISIFDIKHFYLSGDINKRAFVFMEFFNEFYKTRIL